MSQVTYSSPTATDLKAKEASPSYVEKSKVLLQKIAFMKYECVPSKHDGSGFFNNPFRDLLKK